MSPDDEILALLETVPNLNVHVGSVDVDEAQKVVTVPMPYIVYSSGVGEDEDERLGGRPGLRSVPFSTFYAGVSLEQARWVGSRSRAALSRKRVTVDGRESGLILLRESTDIRRDDDYTTAGGDPIFYGLDRYVVPI